KIDILFIFFGLIATIVIWITRTRIDKRSFVSLGLTTQKSALRDIVAGYFISAVLVGTILAIEIGFGWVSFEVVPLEWPALLSRILYLFFVTGLVVAWWENLFFVSYLFINVRDGCGFWCSFIINCLISGLVHSINPNASVWAFAGIVLIHSYEIFGFLKMKNLWLILGIHAGWNSFQGLTGFNVSGRTGNQVINQINMTPKWLGGGDFGPEAGLIILLIGIIAFALIHYYSKWTNEQQNAH
ncbi:CPBP family intramembrane metalloprotease, partial [bacterium]|nr:CPBP family intramembrane metalloprotease [bacterium]